jgi:hypothetical protein
MKKRAVIRYYASKVFREFEAYIFINNKKFLYTTDLGFAIKIYKELMSIPRAIDWHLC